MKINSDKNFFEPRARLLLQLGDKLIKNENIALLELIKNSFDADSRKVTVKLRNLSSKENGYIEIIDDGEGMSMKIIEDVWLQPGSDHKELLTKKNIRTRKYKRLPIGEKGIGRFGVHKLGSQIELVSRQKDKNEVVVIIDWREFAKEKFLKDAKFEVFERTPEYFKRTRTGTKITISGLKTAWDNRMVRELYKSVFTLNSPFHKVGKFKVDIDLDNKGLLDKLPVWEDIKDFALWHFKCKIKGHEIVEFEYDFTPWESMIGVSGRKINIDDDYISDRSTLIVKSKERGKKEEILNLGKKYGDKADPKSIGEISFEGYIFDRDKTTLELSNHLGISLLKQYLDEQGGIRVYRDNIRINEYGERGNDWLNLDSRRVNIPAKRVSNSIVLGIIDLKQEESNALIEKTNREGFIENEAFNDFCSAILYVLNIIETLRKTDKDAVRTKINPTEKQEPVLHSIGKLKELVDKRIDEKPLRDKINKYLDKIEDDYNHINEILLTSAGVGLTMGVGIHEVEKVISELKKMVEKENVPENIFNLVKHLDEIIENYSDLFRQSEKDEQDLVALLKGSIFNIQYRLRAHNIIIVENYLAKKDTIVKVSKRLLLGAVMNIIDNSIYWLDRKFKKLKANEDLIFKKKIYFDLIMEDNYISILIADNGFGFGIPTNQLSKPFISDKPNGMGLGLHIVNEIMKVHDGILYFPELGEYLIPEEFENGAIVVLKLKK